MIIDSQNELFLSSLSDPQHFFLSRKRKDIAVIYYFEVIFADSENANPKDYFPLSKKELYKAEYTF